MTAKERNGIREFASLVEGNDCKCTSPTDLPIHGGVFRVDLTICQLKIVSQRWWTRALIRFVSQAFFVRRRLS